MDHSRPFRLAVTADLHYGARHPVGNRSTQALVNRLIEDPPDLLILAGDVGAGDDFLRCLELFDRLDCRKALVPGNHDIWVRHDDARGDSQVVYDEWLPDACREHGFEYLDHQWLTVPECDLAIVGTMNWYDYSWSVEQLKDATTDWEERLRTKRFSRGMHNDANFVRWPFTDRSFADRCVERFQAHLEEALGRHSQAVVVTHHPPVKGLLYPGKQPPTLDGLLWMAFSGNTQLESLVERHAARIPFVFCGHTHAARECNIGPSHGINIGGDYHFKRLVRVEFPTRAVTAEEFPV
jgi:predicted phosphohydrolase